MTDKAWYARTKADPARWARYVERRAGYKHRQPSNRREQYRTNCARLMLHRARLRAATKGFEFNIDEGDVVIPKVCPVLGLELTVGRGAPGPCSPSLDRMDNSLGYVKGNVRVISNRANSLKSDATIEELRAVLAYVEANEF